MALLGDPNIVHVALRRCTWMAMAMATVTATRCCGVAQGDLAPLKRQRESHELTGRVWLAFCYSTRPLKAVLMITHGGRGQG